ncbi:MAG: ABC transporter permease [Bifidobacteriaceae bacterium]|jgi:peptide/nickel transport system permease protein|nr:ABC transporter permease [Bifidobacteriaceae bacterium]
MLRWLVAKAARSIGVLLVSTFAVFSLMFGNGPGIARAVAGLRATDEDVARLVVELGLDRPLPEQYWSWLTGVIHGDLGRSYFTGQSVSSALATRVPVTLGITAVTVALTAVIAVLLGVAAATRGGWVDRGVQFGSVLGTAVPSFIVAIALVFAFAINVRWLPATGYNSPERGIGAWLASITLPTLALLIGSVASAAQQFRAAAIETMSQDFVRTLRARGVAERAVVFRHVLRNSAGPGLTVLSLQVFGVLGGAVFIEQVFAIPGIGQLGNKCAQQGDVPMVMGAVVVTIFVVLIVNFAADLVASLLNPKARAK